jgi:sulfatase modifying factor 1
MVALPPGGFTMGVPAGEEEAEGVPQEWRGQSVPQTRITFPRGVIIGKYPVTRQEYWNFLSATGHRRGSSCWHLTEQADKTWKFQDRPDVNWEKPGFAQTADHPSVCVNWDDAVAYAEWLSRQTGQRYRLPSEAEWEYAARAGTPGPRWWPGGRASACGYANVRDFSLAGAYNVQRNDSYFQCSDGYANTSPVTAFGPNPFGLHDMLGNVRQWTQDCWNPNLQGQPTNGNPRLSGDCSLRVTRGGSWLNLPRVVRAGNRYGVTAGFRSTNTGFRVSRTP